MSCRTRNEMDQSGRAMATPSAGRTLCQPNIYCWKLWFSSQSIQSCQSQGPVSWNVRGNLSCFSYRRKNHDEVSGWHFCLTLFLQRFEERYCVRGISQTKLSFQNIAQFEAGYAQHLKLKVDAIPSLFGPFGRVANSHASGVWHTLSLSISRSHAAQTILTPKTRIPKTRNGFENFCHVVIVFSIEHLW